MCRRRLTARLDRRAALTVLQALPGYGKTTLAAHWATRRAEAGDVVAWIDMVEELNDTGAFFARLHDELAAADEVSSRTGPVGADPADRPWQLVADALRDEEDRRVIVVLDMFHVVDDVRLIADLCALLAEVPRLRIVVCSRFWHPLQMAAQHRGLDVTTITGRDLRADAQELIAVAAALGHQLTPPDAEGLLASTDGWLLPSKLVLDASSGSWGTDDAVAVDFLRAAVLPAIVDLAALETATRLALTQAVAPMRIDGHTLSMSMPAQDASGAGPHDRMVRLERAGLIERARVEGSDSWTIPPLLCKALAMEHRSAGRDAVTGWHRAFARALRENGDQSSVGVAVRHARLGDDWAFLVEAWSTDAQALVNEHTEDLLAVYRELPAHALVEHRGLAIPCAVARAIAEHPHGVAAQHAVLSVFRGLQEAPRHGASTDEDDVSVAERAHALSVTIMSDRAQGRFGPALAAAARLDRDMAETEPGDGRMPPPVPRAWVLRQWAQTLLLAGDSDRAVELASRAFSLAQGPSTFSVAANAASDLALMHAIDGSTEDARHWLSAKDSFDTSGRWMDYLVSLPAHLAAVLLALDRLDRAAAEVELAMTDDTTGQAEMWPFVAHAITQHALLYGEPMVALTRIDRLASRNPAAARADGAARRILDRCRADLLLALGELNLAQRVLDDAGPEATWLNTPRARLRLLAGDAVQALRLASASVWDPRTTGRDRIDDLMIKSAAAHLAGDAATAGTSFEQAASLAAQVGTIQPYLLIDAEVRDALLRQCGNPLEDEAIKRIASTREAYPRRAGLVALSSRELVVLYEMTRCDTMPEIAKALTVSLNTVRKQAVSIYAKLGTHDRKASLVRASRLGFLPEPSASGDTPQR